MKIAAAALFASAAVSSAAEIDTLAQLNIAIAGGNNKVGFLSENNFHTVQDILSANVDATIMTNTADLEEAVENGTLVGALISGVPDSKRFNVFSSLKVSPRAMFVAENSHELEEALDAAIVRVIKKGLPQSFAKKNPPFEMVSVFNCMAEPESWPFPNATFTSPVKIAALGPGDWGVDGNYKSNPPVGYWPDYYNAIEKEFKEAYGVGFERVWFSSSSSLMNALRDGTVDATEPYMTIDSFHEGRGRKSQFLISCITMGYDSTFFTRKQAAKEDSGLSDGATVAIAALAGVSGLAILFILFVIKREKSGKPVFQPLILPDEAGGRASYDAPKAQELTGI